MPDLPCSHNLNELFAQLGLPADDASIAAFIQQHRPLPPDIMLDQAPWWTPAQATFLKEALEDDADWPIVVDQLNQSLR